MNFAYTADEQAFAAEVTRFLAEHPPDRFAVDGIDAGYGSGSHSRPFLRGLADQGWLSMTWPKAYGGQERPMFFKLVLLEELALAGAPFGPLAGCWQTADAIIEYGSERLRGEVLPAIARGEATFWQGYSEPGAGSDLLALKTEARRDGDDYVIRGHKIWSSHAGISRYGLVFARTTREARRSRGRRRGAAHALLPRRLPAPRRRADHVRDGARQGPCRRDGAEDRPARHGPARAVGSAARGLALGEARRAHRPSLPDEPGPHDRRRHQRSPANDRRGSRSRVARGSKGPLNDGLHALVGPADARLHGPRVLAAPLPARARAGVGARRAWLRREALAPDGRARMAGAPRVPGARRERRLDARRGAARRADGLRMPARPVHHERRRRHVVAGGRGQRRSAETSASRPGER